MHIKELGVVVLAAVAMSCGLVGCARSVPPAPPVVAAPGDAVYTVRGRIVMLPDPGKPASQLQIHHQPIPDFKSKEGKVHVNDDGSAGMREMTMPFPVGRGVSLDGLKVDDEVEFVFEVRWNASPTYQITRITRVTGTP